MVFSKHEYISMMLQEPLEASKPLLQQGWQAFVRNSFLQVLPNFPHWERAMLKQNLSCEADQRTSRNICIQYHAAVVELIINLMGVFRKQTAPQGSKLATALQDANSPHGPDLQLERVRAITNIGHTDVNNPALNASGHKRVLASSAGSMKRPGCLPTSNQQHNELIICSDAQA